MRHTLAYSILLTLVITSGCTNNSPSSTETMVRIYETSAKGHLCQEIQPQSTLADATVMKVNFSEPRQEISGFGGAFTEASASLLNRLSEEKSNEIIQRYFSEEGSRYSLMRTHMNSCDFSLSNYSYTPVADDVALEHFSIDEDRADLIPMILRAQKASKEGFRLFASPWTAAPWMKDNNSWVGGKLLPKYYDTWARFFAKYVDAYKAEGIDIWGFTVENEPHGNGNNWESMLYSPQEMTDFVANHLGPVLEKEGKGDLVILGYDQNREGLREWVDEMYRDEHSSRYFDGTAVHWYESTVDYFPEELEYAHFKAPDKFLIQTEACVDAEVPVWKDDAWYWKKEATDWGYTWREESKKYLHPKYAPVNRYARDIIGCMNHWVDGWVDWNMVLDRRGGPNWKENWCIAPVIVDPDQDEVYYTPLFYVLQHFSKFIRPGARVYSVEYDHEELMATAAKNPDGTTAVVVFNEGYNSHDIALNIGETTTFVSVGPQTLQTITIAPKTE